MILMNHMINIFDIKIKTKIYIFNLIINIKTLSLNIHIQIMDMFINFIINIKILWKKVQIMKIFIKIFNFEIMNIRINILNTF